TATSEISTLSLHDALPICALGLAHRIAMGARSGDARESPEVVPLRGVGVRRERETDPPWHLRVSARLNGRRLAQLEARQVAVLRSEEHTSELQSRVDLVCR